MLGMAISSDSSVISTTAPAYGARSRAVRDGLVLDALGFGRMSSRVLTAVAWPYANGPRHIGHVSGFGVPSDVFSRFMRMSGHDVLMVSGTDEHGTPILVQAEREGLTTRETADKYNRVIVEDLQGLGLSYDLFTRTMTRNHYRGGAGRSSSACTRTATWCPRPSSARCRRRTGRTLPDRYIEGTCPICGYDERARRPVRQLRQPARPGRPDQPAVPDQRRDAEVRRDRALLPRPAGAGRIAGQVAGRADRLAAQRAQVQPEPAGGPASPGRSPATSTGGCRCRWTAGGTSR